MDEKIDINKLSETDTNGTIVKFLSDNPKTAYSISGIIKQCFDGDSTDSFYYQKVYRACKTLSENGLIRTGKFLSKVYYYVDKK